MLTNTKAMVKDNPLKTLIAMFTLLSLVTGLVFSADNRYELAADADKHAVEMMNQLISYRKDELETKIFVLELKQFNEGEQLDNMENALLNRYKRKLADLESRGNQ